jgi:hypothetical protein
MDEAALSGLRASRSFQTFPKPSKSFHSTLPIVSVSFQKFQAIIPDLTDVRAMG